MSKIELVSGDDWNAIISSICSAYNDKSKKRPLLVAVSGVPGSGKTTLAKEIVRALNNTISPDVAVNMPMDGYHLYRSELSAMPNAEEAFRRRGAPWTFNSAKLLKDLTTLKSTGEISAPAFDHAAKDPVEDAVKIFPSSQIVVMEGNYLTHCGEENWKRVTLLFDLKIFLRVPSLSASTDRLAKRHQAAWGISFEEAMDRAGGSDFENAKLVEGTVDNADIVCNSLPCDSLAGQ